MYVVHEADESCSESTQYPQIKITLTENISR